MLNLLNHDIIGMVITIAIIAFLIVVHEGTIDWKDIREAKREYKKVANNDEESSSNEYLKLRYYRTLPPKKFYWRRTFLILLELAAIATLAWTIYAGAVK